MTGGGGGVQRGAGGETNPMRGQFQGKAVGGAVVFVGVHGGVRGKGTNVDSWRGDRKVVREERMEERKWRGEGMWNRGRTRGINSRREREEREECAGVEW